MKARINNKSYNTDTAKLIASDGNGLPCSDFGWWAKHLYQKRTGEYFLHCEGGPMTIYRSSDGLGNYGYGDEIKLLTEAQAQKFLANLDKD